jgi:branched-chain amino acid transport system ATP-binding protein
VLLEVEDLTIHYGKAKAIEGVSLKVDDGEIVCIVGSNGAGKTTIISAISGLKRATSGTIRFQGRRIDHELPHQIVKMGIAQVPAGRMIFSPMTVLDNLKMGAYLRRDRSSIRNDLENVYAHFPILKERQNQVSGQLSGGQQQMLAIARALMARPKLIMLDEPSIGLSPLLVAEVAKIVQEVNRQGIGVLLVEQNCRMALELATRAYVLEQGVIALEGEAAGLASDERVQSCYLGGA